MLLWVDIDGRTLHRFDPATGEDRALELESQVCAAAPMADGGRVLVALADHLAAVDEATGDAQTLVAVPHPRERMRLNDGACDPAGRFWVGSMTEDDTPGLGALYRYDGRDGLVTVLTEVSLSNGLGWSPDGQRMYYVDSPTQRIDLLDFDLATGTVSGRQPFARIDAAASVVPDGLAVDDEGGVWVALYGGGQVRRYDPEGALDAVIEVPAENVTACCFGGEDGRRLFITTARSPQPLGGNLFAADPGVSGPPAVPFAG